jgi:hypothetical protein
MSEIDDALEHARRLLGQMAAIREEIEADLDEMVLERAQTEPEREEEAADFAAHARSGDYGPDWKVLQRRIDLGETSREDVVMGRDQSHEAQAVREMADRNVGYVVDLQNLDDESDAADENDEIFASVRRQQQEILAQLERIRQMPQAPW